MHVFISNMFKKHDRTLPSLCVIKHITLAKKLLVKNENFYDLRYKC